VPARVGGTWAFHGASGESFEVELEQTYQNLTGGARGAAVTGKVAGELIELAFVEGGEPVRIKGTVADQRIAATVTRGAAVTEYVGVRR
jgi:hypothetical protein